MGLTPAQARWLETRFARVAAVMQESQGRAHQLEAALEEANSKLGIKIETRYETFSTLIGRITQTEHFLQHLSIQIGTAGLGVAGVTMQHKTDYENDLLSI